MPTQKGQLARLPAEEQLDIFTQRSRCPWGKQCLLQRPASIPVQQALGLEAGEQVEGVHVRPQIGVITGIVAVYQMVEGMRRVLEIGQGPVATKLTGIAQALLEDRPSLGVP